MMPRDPDIEPEEEETAETEIEEPEALQQALAEEKKRAEEYLSNWQRTQADFVNYKRRSEQERGEIGKYANCDLVNCIIPALDDFERALEHVGPEMSDDNWVEGIRLIERNLKASLESQGVQEIKAIGEKFDPNFHEAAMHDTGPEGMVVRELQKGYILHDRVIRPSMVVVGNGETESEEEDETEEDD